MAYGHEDHCPYPGYACKCKMSGVTPFDNWVERTVRELTKELEEQKKREISSIRGKIEIALKRAEKFLKVDRNSND